MTKIWLVLLAFLAYLIWITVNSWPTTLTKVIFCDVGQGDATLITRGTTQLLIDGGPDDKVLECLSGNLPWWDRQLEMVIATHADADHIAGLPSVLQAYQVDFFMTTGQGKKTDVYQALLTQMRAEKGMMVIVPELGKRLVLGPQTVVRIVWPETAKEGYFDLFDQNAETQLSDSSASNQEKEINYNDGSISLYLTIGQVSILLTGDLEAEGEKALVEAGLTKHLNVLKAGHHGSKTSTTPLFLEQLRPELTIISCGLNNRYGHPATEVLSRLEEAGSRVLRTDQVGEIALISDGREYWLTF